MTFPELQYPHNGRVMSPHPRYGNIHNVEQLATTLRTGQPCSIILEPGDMTRYEFVIVPMWGIVNGMVAWTPHTDFMLVVRASAGDPRNTPVVLDESVSGDRLAPLCGPRDTTGRWEHELFGWFFRGLWALMLEQAKKENMWFRDDESTQSLLLLIDMEVPLEVIKAWSDSQVEEVDAYASTEHLVASDNDLERLPMPEVLKPYARGWDDDRPSETDLALERSRDLTAEG